MGVKDVGAALIGAFEVGFESVYGSAAKGATVEIARLRGVRSLAKPLRGLPTLSRSTLTRYRRIARAYARPEVEALAAVVRAAGAVWFNPNFLARLAAVPRPKARLALARRAVREQWSYAEFSRAVIAARPERRANVGRKPDVPPDPAAATVAFEGACLKWLRWATAAAADGGSLAAHAAVIRAAGRAVTKAKAAVTEGAGTGGPQRTPRR